MFCPRCGAQHTDSARFCPGCGQPLGFAVVAQTRPARRSLWSLVLALLCVVALAGMAGLNWFGWPGPQLRHERFVRAADVPGLISQTSADSDVTPSAAEVAVYGTAAPSVPIPMPEDTRTPTWTATVDPTVTPSPTRTQAPTPTRTPKRTATASAAVDVIYTQTPTLTPTPTSTPMPTPIPFTCQQPARGEFAGVWQSYGARLGCPVQTSPLDHTQVTFVEQPFESGHMFFFQSGSMKFVFVQYGAGTSGTWVSFDDAWDGRNDNNCFEAQDIQPRILRGFNYIWCTHPEIREPLGRPVDVERDLDLEMVQGFDKGFIVRDSDGYTRGLVYVFFYKGTWERVPY